MISSVRLAAALGLGWLLTASSARGVGVTQLFGPGEFTSVSQVVLDFESPAFNVPPVTFDATTARFTSLDASGGVTTSGMWGLFEGDYLNDPMRAEFAVDVQEVGMYFGNDDFGLTFNAVLEAFDANNVSLGSVSVTSNVNDLVDQYIGLRSDAPIRAVGISYSRPQAMQLGVYIDDFTVGLAVPEPGTLPLAAAAIAALLSLVNSSRSGSMSRRTKQA